MKRIVLDTNVLAAGYRSRGGASFALLEAIGARRIRPLVTVALFIEYEAVLKRTEQASVHGMSNADVDRALAGLLTLAEAVEINYSWRPQLSDAKDEMVLEAAINGHADALVTHNIRDFDPAKHLFGVRILKPSELLQELRT